MGNCLLLRFPWLQGKVISDLIGCWVRAIQGVKLFDIRLNTAGACAGGLMVRFRVSFTVLDGRAVERHGVQGACGV